MILIHNGTIVNENTNHIGYIIIKNDRILKVGNGKYIEGGDNPPLNSFKNVINASDSYIMPGIIDDQVHFREPGLVYKGDISSESRAALIGGVTSYMEMPNTKPPTITNELWNQKMDIAHQNSFVNYSFYLGATNDNINEIENVDVKRTCGIKLFMGSSTGNMLVDNKESLATLFKNSPLLIAAHCEKEDIIRDNIAKYKAIYGDDIKPEMHPLIRSDEACYRSSAEGIELATKYGARFHVLHISSAKEMSLFESKPYSKEKKITSEVCVHHLWFSDADYKLKGNFIKWNPAIKTELDREALVESIKSNKIDIIATDHAPHTLEEKMRNYWEAPSGGPMVSHSLITMLELHDKGEVTLNDIVKKMCHTPADMFDIKDRGYLKEGYYADIAVIKRNSAWTVSKSNIIYKCGWSPLEGISFNNKVTHTIVNGNIAYNNGQIDESSRGKELEFNR